MSERSSHAPGTFSWADLSTSDAQAAKRFYGELFGWGFDDMPAGEGAIYTMAKKGTHSVAALSQMADQPPHWNNYVTVESADASANRAQELGGTVVMPAFDVLDAGRMAVVQDPTGAMLCVWEPRANIGATLVNAPGSMTWNDLTTGDVATARQFYADLFGWRIEEVPDSGGYHVIYNGDRTNGGMREARDLPAFWLPYFGIDDVEAGMEKVRELGGAIHAGPIPVPQGSFAAVADPQGAAFAIWAGVYDD